MLPSLPQKKLDLIDSNFLFTEIGIGKREKKSTESTEIPKEMRVVLPPMNRREAFHLVRRLENLPIIGSQLFTRAILQSMETRWKQSRMEVKLTMLLLDHAPMNKASSDKNKVREVQAIMKRKGDKGSLAKTTKDVEFTSRTAIDKNRGRGRMETT
ncbi:hypothetical protein Tco_0273021 [Tanacetum coccineum]